MGLIVIVLTKRCQDTIEGNERNDNAAESC